MAEEKPQVPISALPEFKSNPDGFFIPGYKGTQPTSKADIGKMIDSKTKQALAQTQKQIDGINRDMGKYQQLPDVTLTLVESGKRIDKDGKFVADAQWNIGRLGAVSKGNIYELLMGGSDKMVLGTALFVSHTVERIGGVDTDVYTPIFSAVTTDLPVSNYAVLLAGEDYADVLVSYRADVAGSNVMRVSRWGIFASLATQYANLKKAVDLKSFADGYYKNMRVGNADTLTIGSTAPTYNETLGGRQVNNAPEMMGTRDAASTNSTSNISVQEVSGVAIAVNFPILIPSIKEDISNDGITATNNRNGYFTFNGTATASFYYHGIYNVPTIKGHKQILIGGSNDGLQIYDNNTPRQFDSVQRSVIFNGTGNVVYLSARVYGGKTTNCKIYPVIFDLTLLPQLPTTFVNSLGKNDAIKVAHALSFFAFDRTAANAVTHDESATLAKMAEIVAKMGYQEPKFTWAGVGRYNLVDGKTGRIKQSIDKIAQKTNAWNKALAVLRERGIDIPTFLEKPTEFGVNDNVCVKWTNDHLEVNCWVVDLGRLSFAPTGYGQYYAILPSKKVTNIYDNNMMLIGHEYNYQTVADGVNCPDKSISNGNNNNRFYIKDSTITSASQASQALQGQYLVFQLAEPIIIPLDEPMNINFVDAKPYDLYTLDDMDGEPMYEVEVTPRTDGTYHTVVAPKAEWVEQHKSLPITIKAALAGIGTNVGYDFIMNLEQRIRNLENK